jgi:shikimate dehydrogenase
LEQFGLIGSSLSHSFSKQYFDEKFRTENIKDCAYNLFELDQIESLSKVFDITDLVGINVTIPYKESIIPFLTKIDPLAKEIGAVNTVLINGDDRIGYNTDIVGFKKSISPFLAKEHTRALILGTGGASKAIAIALKQYDIKYFYCSNSKPTEGLIINYSDLDEQIVNSFPLIINCTPIGTFPNINEMPPIPINGMTQEHLIFDLVYNPLQSKLLKEAKNRGALICNGLNMLKIQAEESWKIWKRQI